MRCPWCGGEVGAEDVAGEVAQCPSCSRVFERPVEVGGTDVSTTEDYFLPLSPLRITAGGFLFLVVLRVVLRLFGTAPAPEPPVTSDLAPVPMFPPEVAPPVPPPAPVAPRAPAALTTADCTRLCTESHEAGTLREGLTVEACVAELCPP